METGITVAVGIVLGIVGFMLGRGAGRKEGSGGAGALCEERMRSVAAAVARGGLPDAGAPGSGESALRDALESGWAPRHTERARALQEALERVGVYLDQVVRKPLSEAGSDADLAELRERIARAVGALEDVEFFLAKPSIRVEGGDLVQLTQQVTREFAGDQGVSVRMQTPGHPVRAKVASAAFMDALYLVLHNAGRFGGGGVVTVAVTQDGGRAAVCVRDRGPGFTEEAFKRAFDPFYSTSTEGLGLGLPHARTIVEEMGGKLEIRNVPDGGAEVEVSFNSL
ncbi:MAG: HAMP domain-containing histidine kinase [Gemmatimonadota bacterium]|nr:HAMP domain-containing histidine kinase [Gemmatimonadota bacterium]MDH5759073.1 HAMP domain-containing histidine kinase [Gemmatimonadota bacterium]